MEEDIKLQMKNIVLIGPVYPYKGGIAHYTSLLYRALTKEHHVSMISYRFQYPKLLYKKKQKDYSNDDFKIDDTKYWIHTGNPFNWISTAKKIKELKPDMIIIQWWHPYFAPCYYILSKLLKKLKILYLCHNVFPHERFLLDALLTKIVLKTGDGFIVQSQSDSEDLKLIIPNAVYKQTVHPTYNAFKFTDMTKIEARKRLKLNSENKVLLFFGFVREYKGLKHLIRGLPCVLKKFPEIKLLIAGDFSDDKEDYLQLIKDNGIEEAVYIFDGYIPDREVEKFFMASDLVVLPYESATQSGIVQLAYGFNKPVIVTDVGGLPDVVINQKTGYVVEAKKQNQIAEAIEMFYVENRQDEFMQNIKKETDRFSWDRLVKEIGHLYNNLFME